MKKSIFSSVILLIAFSSGFSATHIFWYKAKTNNYALTDCNPGPCLPRDAVVREGIMISGSWGHNNTISLENIKLGYAKFNKVRSSGYIWSYDMNAIAQGKIKSAKFRAEYVDRWVEGNAFCVSGRLSVRCGVVNFGGNIAAFGGLDRIPADAMWMDKSNIIRDSMGFDARLKSLHAEEIKTVIIPEGKKTRSSPGKLDGKFFEIDITQQVSWIAAHPGGQYGIMFLVDEDEKNSGMVSTYTIESGLSEIRFHGNRPWTQDGNTCHILIKEDENDPLVFAKGKTAVKAPPTESIAWASPNPFSVIRSDSIKIGLEVHGKRLLDNIVEVNYYASYFNHGDSAISDLMIGKLISPPYELWWNCRDIPDHSIGKLKFSCDIIRKDGNDSSFILQAFVLDRNPTQKHNTLNSFKTKRPVVIDGNMQEWRRRSGITLEGRDNRVTIFSQWDMDFLYFGIQVIDTNVISHYPPGSSIYSGLYYSGIYDEDEIEIFLDPRCARLEFMDLTHKQFLIGAAGMTYSVSRDSGKVIEDLKPNVKSSAQVLGTLNKGGDIDTGYIIEYAIPWEVIGIIPSENLSIGLELLNADLDTLFGGPRFYSWSGTKASNLHNPSEWGTLVLRKGHSALFVAGLLTAGLLLFLIPISIVIIRKRQRSGRENEAINANISQEISPDPEKEEIKRAKQYIEEHYQEHDLNREKIATFVGFHPEYFSSFFKKETGQGFIEYLNKFRTGKAEELLLNTKLRISEIAQKTGFSYLDSFEKTFKKIKLISPSDFRLRKNP